MFNKILETITAIILSWNIGQLLASQVIKENSNDSSRSIS